MTTEQYHHWWITEDWGLEGWQQIWVQGGKWLFDWFQVGKDTSVIQIRTIIHTQTRLSSTVCYTLDINKNMACISAKLVCVYTIHIHTPQASPQWPASLVLTPWVALSRLWPQPKGDGEQEVERSSCELVLDNPEVNIIVNSEISV